MAYLPRQDGGLACAFLFAAIALPGNAIKANADPHRTPSLRAGYADSVFASDVAFPGNLRRASRLPIRAGVNSA